MHLDFLIFYFKLIQLIMGFKYLLLSLTIVSSKTPIISWVLFYFEVLIKYCVPKFTLITYTIINMSWTLQWILIYHVIFIIKLIRHCIKLLFKRFSLLIELLFNVSFRFLSWWYSACDMTRYLRTNYFLGTNQMLLIYIC